MRVKNTYSRKKPRKPGGNLKSNVVNISFNFIQNNYISVNVANHSSTQQNPGSSTSEASDLFDKLVEGPRYNVNDQSKLSSSEIKGKFFTQRQDTATFYKSDAELSVSTDISNDLFKDSKNYEYSPLWISPPNYCKINNKLIKVINGVNINKIKNTTSQKKSYNRVKKKPNVAKKKKILVEPKCTSSTPNRSNAILSKAIWPDTHVSPIVPQHYSSKNTFSSEHLQEIGLNEKAGDQNYTVDVNALIEGLGNLGIATPHHKNIAGIPMGYPVNQELKLFNYKGRLSDPKCSKEAGDFVNSAKTMLDFKSNLSSSTHHIEDLNVTHSNNQKLDCNLFHVSQIPVSQNCQSEQLNKDEHSQQFGLSNLCKELGETNTGAIDLSQVDSLHPSVYWDVNNQKSEEKAVDSRSEQFPCPSPDLTSNTNINSSASSPIISSCSRAPTISEYSKASDDETTSSGNVSSLTPKQEISSKDIDETDSRKNSLRSSEKIICDLASDAKHTFGSKENSENYSSFVVVDGSMEDLRVKNNLCNLEETDGYGDVTKNKGKGKRTTEFKEVKEGCCFNYQNNEESIVDEHDTNSCTKTNNLVLEGLINSNHNPEELKKCEAQPLSDLTNLTSRRMNKRSVPLCKEKRYTEYVVNNKFSLQTLPTELDETSVKLNLEAGKRWRRSFLRQKQGNFDRRVSMSTNTLIKLINEASFLSGLNNDTKMSYNNTTRFMDSFFGDQDARNSSLPLAGGSPVLNLTMSKLSGVYRRKRRIYLNDINEIPEENSDHSTEKLNITVHYEEESLQQDGANAMECKSVTNATLNQTDLFETPPIMRMNQEALSAITVRKRDYRIVDECSMFSDIGDQDEENSYFEDDNENLNESNIEMMGKVGFMLRCEQKGPIAFTDAFPERILRLGQKIGEGVFGEVFMLERPGEGKSVIKIIPVEGSQMVNGSVQKRFDEVLSELVITEELSDLRKNNSNNTSGFCELKNKFYLQGEYPSQLLKLWHEFDKAKKSENECPDMFGRDQQYLALELAHAGEPVETFGFRTPQQALAVFLQTTFSLAVAESAVEFEHRDLHIGNVLVKKTSEKYITYVINDAKFDCPTSETKATIIDYTLSRMSFRGDVLFLDLEKDPELFTAEGNYQFDIYRHMRQDLNNNWRDHQPKTNIRWLHYLIDKLSYEVKYKQKKTTKVYKEGIENLVRLREIILDFYSATDLAQHLIDSYTRIARLIKLP